MDIKLAIIPFGLIFLLLGGASSVRAGAYDEAIVAARDDRTEVVINLIQRGLDPNTVDAAGTSLMMTAAANGNQQLVEFLLSVRANSLINNRYGDTALALAALNGHGIIVRRLLDSGTPVDNAGWSALHYAAFNGHEGIVRDLIERGANLNARAPNHRTALMFAARNGHEAVVRLLLSAGANPEMGDLEGNDAAKIASAAGNHLIAGLLQAAPGNR